LVDGRTHARSIRKASAVALALVALLASSYASADAPDPTFAGDGRLRVDVAHSTDDGAFDVATTTDGKVIAVGYATADTGTDFAVVRLNNDGGLDKSFSGDGHRTIGFGDGGDDYALGAAVEPNGKIVLAGSSETGGGVAIARLLPSGRLDRRFSGNGRETFSFARSSEAGSAGAVAIQPNGKIVVAGVTTNHGGLNPALARLRPNGELDSRFSRDGRLRVESKLPFASISKAQAGGVAVQRNGRIIVAIDGLLDRERTTLEAARFTATGRPDHQFSGDGRKTVSGVYSFHGGDPSVVLSGHRILLSDSLSPRQGIVAQLTARGELDRRFGRDGRKEVPVPNVDDMAMQGRKIVVTGTDQRAFAFARLKSRGRFDHSFSARREKRIAFRGARAQGFGVAIQGYRKIVGAGQVERAGSGSDFGLVRLTNG
jgi:uncharacterized delta-60 repeat protein